MIKLITWGSCLCLLASQGFSQVPDSVIRMESTFWGTRYLQGQHVLSFSGLGTLLGADPEAYQEYRKAKTSYVAGTALGLTGGLLIGYSVGSALTGRAPHWSVAAAGAGVLLVAIPLNNSFHRRIRKAIAVYNGRTGRTRAYSWYLAPQGAGARLVVRF